MSTPSILDIDSIKRAIRERHLEQLRNLDLVEDYRSPIRTTPDNLARWTNESKTQIAKGQANRVYGGLIGSPPNFDNAFMAFMESAAMYLRDTSTVVKAVETYSRNGNSDEALSLLEKSTARIDAIAKMWDMHFIQICDFVTLHPDGHSWGVGPFCGAFVPNNFNGNSLYIGIAFKGTDATAEIINDLYVNTVNASGRLWGKQVVQGFYYPIFSTYSQTPSSIPFSLIKKAIVDISTMAQMPAITHVTGHSLGGAYSSLTYAQLSIEGFGTRHASLGDLYTFGSPRVGRGDLAKALKDAVCPPGANGSAWRITNHDDPVTQVPASLPWPVTRDPYIHVDAEYRIYSDKMPVPKPSEIGTNPTWSLPTLPGPHYTTSANPDFRPYQAIVMPSSATAIV